LELAQREVAGHQELLRLSKDLRIAKVQGQRLLAMIEDLLAIARLERGTLTPRKETVDLEKLFGEVMSAYEALAQTVDAQVVASVEPCLTASVDRELVQRVLENLLSNALRFVKSGDRVELSAACNGDRLVLTVRNTGQPIAPEMRPRLFERFSGKEERARGNAGLGLYFCRLVAEAHGGSATLEDQPPFNVSFVLRLPLS
jgi:signal transduction histidine kinase